MQPKILQDKVICKRAIGDDIEELFSLQEAATRHNSCTSSLHAVLRNALQLLLQAYKNNNHDDKDVC